MASTRVDYQHHHSSDWRRKQENKDEDDWHGIQENWKYQQGKGILE
jgi:hypothetical protein